jgi:hypothetical protein
MFDVLITIATGLFFTKYWSKWRYGYFDFFCAGAAIVGAFLLPALVEKFVPEFSDLGVIAFDAGGALVGCLLYDAASFGWR